MKSKKLLLAMFAFLMLFALFAGGCGEGLEFESDNFELGESGVSCLG